MPAAPAVGIVGTVDAATERTQSSRKTTRAQCGFIVAQRVFPLQANARLVKTLMSMISSRSKPCGFR
ncbi:hypothetical protein C6Q15_14735 [Burkholderia multivorans]|uniref:Uncharacterized protein n=1 Tax=Burkholderia multivorans TaxID=87883 RepID=A0A2S9MPY4_9BURK|nr:hypothetical protein C6Q07_00600 [Burkholderia multivorans]PRF60733.1 hypothetical protein C6Q15_14735 [Burkholderia multivorans]